MSADSSSIVPAVNSAHDATPPSKTRRRVGTEVVHLEVGSGRPTLVEAGRGTDACDR